MDAQGWRYLRNGAYTAAALLTAHLAYTYYRLATSTFVARGMDNPQGLFFGWGESAGLVADLRSQLYFTALLAALAFGLAFLAQYNAGREAREAAARGESVGAGQEQQPPYL